MYGYIHIWRFMLDWYRHTDIQTLMLVCLPTYMLISLYIHNIFTCRHHAYKDIWLHTYNMHMFTHTYIHTYIHTFMHACVHAYNIYVCMHSYIHTSIPA